MSFFALIGRSAALLLLTSPLFQSTSQSTQPVAAAWLDQPAEEFQTSQRLEQSPNTPTPVGTTVSTDQAGVHYVYVRASDGGDLTSLQGDTVQVLVHGATQTVASFEPLGSGDDLGGAVRIALYFDPVLTTPDGLERSADWLAERADQLVRLGPVEIVFADPAPSTFLAPTTDAESLKRALAEIADESLAAGELDWVRDDFADEVERAQESDRASVGVALESLAAENRLLGSALDGFLAWSANGSHRDPRWVILAADGFDLDPREFYLGDRDGLDQPSGEPSVPSAGKVDLEQPRSASGVSGSTEGGSEAVGIRFVSSDIPALGASGWIVTPLVGALRTEPQSLGFTAPLAPLELIAQASGGEVMQAPEDLDRTLVAVGPALDLADRRSDLSHHGGAFRPLSGG